MPIPKTPIQCSEQPVFEELTKALGNNFAGRITLHCFEGMIVKYEVAQVHKVGAHRTSG